MKKNLIIHGWRDINHSFSVVNQNQLLHLLYANLYNLYHHDEDKYNINWNKSNNSNFTNNIYSSLINSIPQPTGIDYFNSIVYSITYPFLSYNRKANEKIFNFIVTEFGLTNNEFRGGSTTIKNFNDSDDFIITPSDWSKRKLLNSGFVRDKIFIIPHGVDTEVYFSHSENNRNILRNQIGVNRDSYCFLNIGAMTFNKGIDLLIEAYSKLFEKNKHIKLILKDQSNLYGNDTRIAISNILKANNKDTDIDLIESIILITENLSVTQLNSLYNIADCYVSPYRAEGFNIPVLEAMACGCPVIVSEGGSTDDFVNVNIEDWYKIKTIKKSNSLLPSYFKNKYNSEDYHLEPIVESIYNNMQLALNKNYRNLLLSNYIKDTYNWTKVCQSLSYIF